MGQQKPRYVWYLPLHPGHYAGQIADQIIVLPDHAPTAGAPAVAAVVDGNHVDLEPGNESFRNPTIASAVLGESMRNQDCSAGCRPAPPPAAEHNFIPRAHLDLPNDRLRRRHLLARLHLLSNPPSEIRLTKTLRTPFNRTPLQRR